MVDIDTESIVKDIVNNVINKSWETKKIQLEYKQKILKNAIVPLDDTNEAYIFFMNSELKIINGILNKNKNTTMKHLNLYKYRIDEVLKENEKINGKYIVRRKNRRIIQDYNEFKNYHYNNIDEYETDINKWCEN
jgi:hypothetical protein